jgi:hypothetical protein
VTLLYSAHDLLHNGAVVLRDYLEEQQLGHRRGNRAGRGLSSRPTDVKKPAGKGRASGSVRRRAR